jgi:hypothetical protein
MFKRIAILLTTVALLLVTVTLSAETYRAIVIDDAPGGCGWIGLADGGYVFIHEEQGKRLIASHSKNGNFTLVCKAKGIPNDSGKAWTWKAYDIGVYCSTNTPHGQMFTDDAQYTLTPSGVATTTCHFTNPVD